MAEQTPSRPTRRQLSLLLPEAQRVVVEPIRQRLDPIQYSLIPAHITLCRDDELPEPSDLAARLLGLRRVSITVAFGGPEELADGCVLVRPVSGLEQFQDLRQQIVGPGARQHGAHLTLLHPRNATGAVHDLSAIANQIAGLVITFQSVALIEQRGCDPWQVKGEYPSAI